MQSPWDEKSEQEQTAASGLSALAQWRESGVVFATTVIVAIFVIWPSVHWIDQRQNRIGPVLPMGMLFASLGVLAIWLMWGRPPFVARLLVTGAGVGAINVAVGFGSHRGDGFLVFAMITVGAAIIAKTPILWGVHRRKILGDGSLPEDSKPSQFSIRDVLAWTMLFAVGAMIVRWGLAQGIIYASDLITYVLWSVRLGCCVLLAMWCTLSSVGGVKRLLIALAVAVNFGVLVELISELIGEPPTPDRLNRIATMGTTVFFLTIPLWLVRRAGFRLVRRRKSKVYEQSGEN